MSTPTKCLMDLTMNDNQREEAVSLIHDESSASAETCSQEEIRGARLRRKLMFHFLDPIEKWKKKRRFPYKFVIQVIKIFLVTYQLCLYGVTRYDYINYATNSKIALSRIFIRDWDQSREVNNYPPPSGPLAVHTINDLINSVDYGVEKYSALNETIGIYKKHTKSVNICLTYYNYSNLPINYVPEETYKCFHVKNTANFSFKNYLRDQEFTTDFRNLLEVNLNLNVSAFSYKPRGPRCCFFDIRISFNNRDMDGLMKISLQNSINQYSCDNTGKAPLLQEQTENVIFHEGINFIIIMLCIVSFILCTRAIVRAHLLKYETIHYFREVEKRELSFEGKFEFYNLWYLMIIVNDILIIIGSLTENKISMNEYTSTTWSICSLCLGTGTMLVWFGVLRYFGFFRKYNIVILTLKRSFPEMMRFLWCTLIIYAGFVFSGWLILGPFHIKFRSISRTSENLFSLINGDDMFATFTILNTDSDVVWWYCRIYMYGFISLFIYVVLNLFLSVILDAYETIKEYYEVGFPKSDLHEFICNSDNNILLNDDDLLDPSQRQCFFKSLFCWRLLQDVVTYIRRILSEWRGY